MIVLAILLSSMFMQSSQSDLEITREEIFHQLNEGLMSTLTVKAILPGGAHAELLCIVDSHTSCSEVQSLPPEELPPKDKVCTSGTAPKLGYVSTCVYENVGTFRFKRSGDKITVYHRTGKTTFKVTGSW